MAKGEVITVKKPDIKFADIEITGDGDLVLNKKNARTVRMLSADDRKQFVQKPNKWEDLTTAIHWRDCLMRTDGSAVQDTYTECDEDIFYYNLEHNAPCISAFGLKKTLNAAVVRNKIDKYSTNFDSAVNIVADRNLVPITFAEHFIDTQIMTPQRGSPITANLHHFSGWKAVVRISFMENVFMLQSIVNIFQLAGFGIGIGSGRTSGFGRYHVSGGEA